MVKFVNHLQQFFVGFQLILLGKQHTGSSTFMGDQEFDFQFLWENDASELNVFYDACETWSKLNFIAIALFCPIFRSL